jgi:hypothetical protein
VAGVRAAEGRALVVRGEPGVGKTVLLDYLAGRASGCRVARAAGVQSETELALAALHQLCTPMLDHAGSLPVPQRAALRTALGLSAGPVPDRFMVGLAVLSLLSETAGERPLLCVMRLLAAARPQLEASGSGWLHAYVPRAPHDDAVLAALRARIGDAAYEEAKAWGGSTGSRQARQYALE